MIGQSNLIQARERLVHLETFFSLFRSLPSLFFFLPPFFLFLSLQGFRFRGRGRGSGSGSQGLRYVTSNIMSHGIMIKVQ